MKVVIFCGGMGIRMGDATQAIPKPMIPVGQRPILWHIMNWYASWGHTDFVLCLGYRAEKVKEYFLSYEEAISNDFVLSGVGKNVELLGRDMEDWRITFVDTGAQTTIGERLRRIKRYIGDDEMFLATYGDGLTDASLDDMVARLERSGKTAQFISVRPHAEYHMVRSDKDGMVTSVDRMAEADVWINGGFFVFRRRIFDVLQQDEDLVDEPFARLIQRGELLAYRHEGFWAPMDTMKDKQRLDLMLEEGNAPWQIGGGRETRRRLAAVGGVGLLGS
jgi:glucose-1-phosphate cytidylyltransferase